MSDIRIIPAPGKCIIREVKDVLTEHGVVIPETTKSMESGFYLVAASAGYVKEGVFVEFGGQPGDQLIMTVGEKEKDAAGNWLARGFPCDKSKHLPDDHYITDLEHVVGVVRREPGEDMH